MINDLSISDLVTDLSKTTVGEYVNNVYKTEYKRQNLAKYLDLMKEKRPDTILVGEALGYSGCGMTGVPFTSEVILNTLGAGFTISGRNTAPTCTIVWELLKLYNFYPLLWNIFPFHPFQKGNICSNRPPNKQEVEQGLGYLNRVIDIFNIKNILAVGKISFGILNEHYTNVKYIRHPANGGKVDFVSGIKDWMEVVPQKIVSTL